VAAYSLNFTVVPPAGGPEANLTTWPVGLATGMPNVSTLNYYGSVVANAAIVPAGTNGAIDVYASYPTDMLFDINGYFAPPLSSGLEFYPVTPCRIADTRNGAGFTGQFGPPSMTPRSCPCPGLGRASSFFRAAHSQESCTVLHKESGPVRFFVPADTHRPTKGPDVVRQMRTVAQMIPIPIRSLCLAAMLLLAPPAAAAISIDTNTATDWQITNGVIALDWNSTTGNVFSVHLLGYPDDLVDLTHQPKGLYMDNTGLGSGTTTAGFHQDSNHYVDWWITTASNAANPFTYSQHFILADNDAGFHVYIVINHSSGDIAGSIGQVQYVFRISQTLFTNTYAVDEGLGNPGAHTVVLPDPSVLNTTDPGRQVQDASVDLHGLPLPAGFGREFYVKYDYSTYEYLHRAQGLFGSTYGAWTVVPSSESLVGGPTKQDLSFTGNILMMECQSNHLDNALTFNVAQGEVLQRLFGPYYFHFNTFDSSHSTPASLYQDALDAAGSVSSFYDSEADLQQNGYVPSTGRGTVQANISGGGSSAANTAWVVLGDNQTNFQYSNVGREYWVSNNSTGNAALTGVVPGTYRLAAYVLGEWGELRSDNVTVTANQTTTLPLTFQSENFGPSAPVWTIGTPDRSAHEFLHGMDSSGLDDREFWGNWNYWADFAANNGAVVYYATAVGAMPATNDLSQWNYNQWQSFNPGLYAGIYNSSDDSTDGYKYICPAYVRNCATAQIPAWQVHFAATAAQLAQGQYVVLSVGLAAAEANLAASLNGHALTWPGRGVKNADAAVRSGLSGTYQWVVFQWDLSQLNAADSGNVITLSVNSQQGVMYDALRLEIANTSANPAVTGWNDYEYLTSGTYRPANDSLPNNGVAVSVPAILAGGVENAAGVASSTAVAPGSLVSIYGSNLANAADATSVTFNNIPAPLLFVSSGQINAQVPWEVTGSSMQVVVTNGNLASAPVTVSLSPAVPAIFTLGANQAIAYSNSDSLFAAAPGSIPGLTTHAARIGDPAGLAILATGLGPVNPPIATGEVPNDGVPHATTMTPTVTVGGVPAQVLFSGMSTYVGLYQINILIQPGTPAGNAIPLQITMNGVVSNTPAIAVTNYGADHRFRAATVRERFLCPDLLKSPLEVATQHQRDVCIRVTAPQKPLGQLVNSVGMVQPGDVVSRMCIQVEIASDSHVFDTHQPHRIVEMVQHVFDRDRVLGPYEVPHGGDTQNASAACGGSNHFVGFAARDARRQRAAVGVGDEDRLFRRSNRVQAGALPAMRHVDRHPDRIHPRDHFQAKGGEPPVMAHQTAVAKVVFGIIGELGQPLAHPVERVHVIHAPEMIRVLHAKDDPDLAVPPGPREVVGAVHADEVIRMPRDEPIPFLEPRPCGVVQLAAPKSDGRVENVDPGAAYLAEIGVSESVRVVMPLIEQRPVQGKQAEHVDDI
jgi:uncharacterized protein (TIGR03437 family)